VPTNTSADIPGSDNNNVKLLFEAERQLKDKFGRRTRKALSFLIFDQSRGNDARMCYTLLIEQLRTYQGLSHKDIDKDKEQISKVKESS